MGGRRGERGYKAFICQVASGKVVELETAAEVLTTVAGCEGMGRLPAKVTVGWEGFSESGSSVVAVDLPGLARWLEVREVVSAEGVMRERGVLLVEVDEWWRPEGVTTEEDQVIPEHRALVKALRLCGWRVVEVKQSDDQMTVLRKIAELA